MIGEILLTILSVTAVFLSQDGRPHVSRWACVVAMASQPFWFWLAVSHGLWSLFIINCFYLLAWARGLKTQWWDKRGQG